MVQYSFVKRAATFSALLLGSAAVMAGTSTTSADNAFNGFKTTVMNWAQGPLGTGLAVTMMLMGAATGVAKNSPMPALSGIAGAAFLNWGPTVITSLTGTGALI